LQQQKFDDACEVSEMLKDTAYSGLYAESKFKQYSQLNQSFLQENFQLEYLYAYNATDSVKFLQNASIYECYNGNYEKAFSYHPIKMTQYSNPEFWAYVSYDSGNYIQAINDAKLMSNKKSVESSIIIADSYLKMRETKLAKQMWDKVISLNPNSDPSVLMNCAFSCLESGKIDYAFEYVKTLVSAFPDYINGLVL
jgi:hypothetical protein